MTAHASVSILGFAACSSLGYSLEATLAAMGAGLSNFTDTTVPGELGHAVVAASLIAEDAQRGDRLAALLQHCWDDVRSLLSPYGVRNLPLLIGVPADLTPEEERGVREALRNEPSAIGHATLFPHGRASTFAALTAGMEVVASRSERFALVAGVDSLCAPAQVRSLVRAGRILSPLTDGAVPGEAAAFALVARTDDPLTDVATSVQLEAVGLKRAATPFTHSGPVSGDALTAAFRMLRDGGASRVHRVIAAHSGEGYFGRSFAHAYLREVEMMPEPLTVELIADRVGDVGAAAGILALAFAVYLMVQDRRNGASRALAYSESDTGEVGAAILEGAPTSWQRLPALAAPDQGRQ